MSPSTAVLLIALVAPCSCTVIQGRGGLGQRSPVAPGKTPGADEAVIKPIKFDQQVLICNAYPSKSPMLVEKNREEKLADKDHPIAFRECRYMKSKVKEQDRLDLMLKDIEVHGTFEISALPSTDAVLLLVLEKRPGSPMISFQSFAFPSSPDGTDAQVAVIDAYRGNSSAPHLQMEDHVIATGKDKKPVQKRVEQLNFNHVYAVEEGTYETSVKDLAQSDLMQSATKKVFKLAKGQNFVVLRTGEDSHFQESLVVFPEVHSGGHSLRVAWFASLVVTLAWALA